jgi:hypothetical protein
MTEGEGKLRIVLITFFPMLIATLSLVTSIFNGYLNNRFVDLIQRNFGRAEYMRTCKETIDAYFQVKFKAGLVSANGEHGPAPWQSRAQSGSMPRRPSTNSQRSAPTSPTCATRLSGRATPSSSARSKSR